VIRSQGLYIECAVKELRDKLASFWTKNETGFNEFWTNLSTMERQRLIRTISPHICISKVNSMCVCGNENLIVNNRLNPGVNLEDLVQGAGDVSAQMRKQCNRDNWIRNDSEGIDYVRSLERNIVIPPFRNPPVELVVLVEGQRGMRYRVKKPAELDPKELMHEIERGVIISSEIWDRMLENQHAMLMVLAPVADEYLTEWAKTACAYLVTAASFACPGRENMDEAQLLGATTAAVRWPRPGPAPPPPPPPRAPRATPVSSPATSTPRRGITAAQ
jgi:hypothetical protein